MGTVEASKRRDSRLQRTAYYAIGDSGEIGARHAYNADATTPGRRCDRRDEISGRHGAPEGETGTRLVSGALRRLPPLRA